jgi:hypothetical protein
MTILQLFPISSWFIDQNAVQDHKAGIQGTGFLRACIEATVLGYLDFTVEEEVFRHQRFPPSTAARHCTT